MPRVRIPGGGWRDLSVELSPQPAHMTNERGERIDLDLMLRRLHLLTANFNGPAIYEAPTVKDTTRCKRQHLWSEYAYVIPGTTTRVCRKCKDDSRLRARESAKKSQARHRSVSAPMRRRAA